MKDKIFGLFELEAFWVSLLVIVFILWAIMYTPEKVESAKPVLLPQRVEQLAKVCTDNGAYGDYLVIEDSRPRQVICKFERKVKTTNANGDADWTRDVYSYDATELEKESKK